MAEKILDWNRKRMESMGRGSERSWDIFKELKRHTVRGKRRSEVQELKDMDENMWSTEEEITECLERTWGTLLNTDGQSILDIRKSGSPMEEGGWAMSKEVLIGAWSQI